MTTASVHQVSTQCACAGIVAGLVLFCVSATAQEAARLEEIVVTAQKRPEHSQDVPVAITALSGDVLVSQGVTGTGELSQAVPGLVVNNTANEGNIYVRGVGTNLFGPNTEQTVGLYVDGVYYPTPEANLFSFNNIDRIEVLKGPQGTLFGRNTTGGVVQIITKDPSPAASADVSVGYANYETTTASIYATTGITSSLATDVAAIYQNQEHGWGHNFTLGVPAYIEADHNYAFSNKWLYTPSDATTIRLKFDFLHILYIEPYQIPEGVIAADGVSTYPGRYNALGDTHEFQRVNTGGVSLNIDHSFDWSRLVSITSYRKTCVDSAVDQDATPLPITDDRLPSQDHDMTEELQLQSPDSSHIKWTTGVFYYNAHAGYTPADVNILSNHIIIDGEQTTHSYAGFAQATAEVLPKTNLTLGARYTSEAQSLTVPLFSVFGAAIPVPRASQNFDKLTYRAALDYHFTQDVLAYISENRGFKSGGFNLLAPTDAPYKPEVLDATEIGLKMELFEHRLRLNSAAFYYNYKDLQSEIPIPGGTEIINGPTSRIKGLEFDSQALLATNLTLSGGATYLEGKYTKFPNAPAITAEGVLSTIDGAGRDTPSTPRFAGNLAVDCAINTSQGEFRPKVGVLYTDSYFYYVDNRIKQPAYAVINSSIDWLLPGDRYSVRLWGQNLANRLYYSGRSEQVGNADEQRDAAPRTYGVTFNAKFH